MDEVFAANTRRVGNSYGDFSLDRGVFLRSRFRLPTVAGVTLLYDARSDTIDRRAIVERLQSSPDFHSFSNRNSRNVSTIFWCEFSSLGRLWFIAGLYEFDFLFLL